MKINKTISVVISAILCGGILLTGCGGGSSTNSNSQKSVSSNSDIIFSSNLKKISDFNKKNSYKTVELEVDTNNTKAFIVDPFNLYIYDITNLKKPKILNAYSVYNGNHNIALVENNKLLFFSELTSLKVLDISNPKKFQEVARYPYSFIKDFVLSNDEKTLFFITFNSNLLSIIDVSNPKDAKKLSSLPLKDVKKLYISNNDTKLYGLLNGLSNNLSTLNSKKGLVILNIEDKMNPILENEYLIKDDTINVNDIAISKDNKIAILATSEGLTILDVNDSYDIKEIITYPNKYIFSNILISPNNKILFGIDEKNSEVSILDISNPQNPQKIDSIKFLKTNP